MILLIHSSALGGNSLHYSDISVSLFSFSNTLCILMHVYYCRIYPRVLPENLQCYAHLQWEDQQIKDYQFFWSTLSQASSRTSVGVSVGFFALIMYVCTYVQRPEWRVVVVRQESRAMWKRSTLSSSFSRKASRVPVFFALVCNIKYSLWNDSHLDITNL